jgi:Zn-dependent alcohol dehydrogenase
LTSTLAIVASDPTPGQKGAENWELQEVFVPTELNDGEVLVEMVATGICHTDISLTKEGMGQGFPIVAGHEGE